MSLVNRIANGRVEIVGAGPAGLSAAIAARSTGVAVTVYERNKDVGHRFHGDFQGLENWTSAKDVLEELSSFGIPLTFDYTAVRNVTYLDRQNNPQIIQSDQPLFYLVRRGSERGTLDYALKEKALADGVEIQFSHRVTSLPNGGLVAEGPHRADIIAVGYVFKTEMPDQCYVAVDEEIAGSGYSYLLIDKGRGTVATCLFENFHNERTYLDNTVAFFESKASLRLNNAQRFGGAGNVDAVHTPILGKRNYLGEAIGWQDALFGFGLRYAMTSGYLAGSSGYRDEASINEEFGRLAALNASSIANRWIYSLIGTRGRALTLQIVARNKDPRRALGHIYAASWWKKLLARHFARTPLKQPLLSSKDCHCTWCRCNRESHSPPASRA